MPRIPPSKPPEESSVYPWMLLHQAVRWALWRGNEPASGDHGDYDGVDPPLHVGLEDVRAVLAAGKLQAWGQMGFGLRDEHELIEPVFWTTRIVSWSRPGPTDRYVAIRVSRAEVMKLWPPPTPAASIGRPELYAWARIKVLADQELSRGLSRTKVAEVLRSRIPVELGGGSPSLSALKEKLREWAASK